MARAEFTGVGGSPTTPMYVRGMEPRAILLPTVIVEDLPARPGAGDLLRRAISVSVERLIRYDAVIRLDQDPEGIHRARVATRRLRTHLGTFGKLLDPDWAGSLRSELAWFGGVLGSARDADVLLRRMQARVADLPQTQAKAGAEVLEALEEARGTSHRELREMMNGEGYERLLERLAAATREPRLTAAADRPARTVLPMVRARWRSLRRRVKRSSRQPTDAELHRIRIRAKRCRYAAEVVVPIVGKPARTFARASAELQTELGEHHDSVVARRWLEEWSARQSSHVAFCVGLLAAGETARAREVRRRWRRSWKALTRTRPSTWA
jgi:CHAD domain-containing protein